MSIRIESPFPECMECESRNEYIGRTIRENNDKPLEQLHVTCVLRSDQTVDFGSHFSWTDNSGADTQNGKIEGTDQIPDFCPHRTNQY